MSCADDDGPSAFTMRVRKARKEHACNACHEAIPKGHRYSYQSGVWDGSPDSFHICLRCRAIQQALEDKNHTFQLTLDCGHDWQEVFEEEPPDDIAALAFALPGEMQKAP